MIKKKKGWITYYPSSCLAKRNGKYKNKSSKLKITKIIKKNGSGQFFFLN